jgi:hypothetical protein
MNPAPKIIVIKLDSSTGKKYKATADQTDKQVTQSKGFILWCGIIENPFFTAFGIPAMFTK